MMGPVQTSGRLPLAPQKELKMPNLLNVLNDRILRVARRETRAQTRKTRRLTSQHRRDIAALKRQVAALTKTVAFLEKQEQRRVTSPPATLQEAKGVRFSARSVKAQRSRLGLSAKDFGRLVGVAALTIYSWESGKSRPRNKQLPALAAVRHLGKREALKRLEMIAGKK
jgi:DNA-binding transcriptional regulator YiaG